MKALFSGSMSLCLLRFRRDQGIPSITCGCSLVTAPRDCGRRTLPVTVARRANTAGRHSHTDAHFPISRVTYKLHTLSVWCTFGLICTHRAVTMRHMICTLARSISFPAHSMLCSHALFFHSLQWLRRDEHRFVQLGRRLLVRMQFQTGHLPILLHRDVLPVWME